MIQFVLLQNRQGKTRLAKWYSPWDYSEKRSIERDVHRLITNRDPKFTNFIEYQTYRIIYRRYAEAIHFFVELLDKFFGNVCELDLVFNFHKVYALIDEFVLAGEVSETNKSIILNRMFELEKLE